MEAVQDASKAVELDPNNAKAYLRKGYAKTNQAMQKPPQTQL
jgi:Flp pilus assembly protein TadD